MADAHHSGPMGGFFATICQTFDLVTPPERLWEQYRRRMPELASTDSLTRTGRDQLAGLQYAVRITDR